MLARSVYDNRRSGSWADQCRRERFRVFASLFENLPRPVRILDVGGTPEFWEQMGLAGDRDFEITLLNQVPLRGLGANMMSVLGDARRMTGFAEGEFEIVFSNSVIEHLGGLDDMARMADEVRRVGRSYFVQTPNRFFPIEPHFVFPLFQFLPFRCQVELAFRFSLGWYPRFPTRESAMQEVQSIRLLSKSEFQALFPGAKIEEERFWGLTKSFMALEHSS